MHLGADEPALRDYAVEDGVPSVVVLRALNERCERMEPARVYDLISSLQLNDDAVVESRPAQNLPGIGANDIASGEARHAWKSRDPFRERDFDRGAAPFDCCVWMAVAAVDGPVGAGDGWPSHAAASRHELKIMRYRIASAS